MEREHMERGHELSNGVNMNLMTFSKTISIKRLTIKN